MSLLNILVLHGKYQSAEVFRTRIGRLPHKAKNVAKLVFIDAPHFMELRPEDTVPMRTWFYREGNTIVQDSLNVTLNYLDDIWKKDGPFDGILGFSMGGSVASMITTFPERYPGIKFVIVGGAPDVPTHLLDNNSISKIPQYIQSLHLIGLADNAVPPHVSHQLASRYTNPIIIEHEQGHCIPTRAIQLDSYVKFMEQFLVKDSFIPTIPTITTTTTLTTTLSNTNSTNTPSNDNNDNNNQIHPLTESLNICELQKEEIEVLSSIYSSTEFEVIGNLPQKKLDPTVKCKVILNPSYLSQTIPDNWIGNLGLQFTLQSAYPLKQNQSPRIEILTGNLSLLDFTLAHKRSLLQTVQQVAIDICQNDGETCLMQCIQAGNDWLSDGGCIIQNNNINNNNNINSNDEQIDSNDLNENDNTEMDPLSLESSSILSDVDEHIENEWIKNATMEAGQAAAFAKKRGILDLDLTHQGQSQDNIIASASARGVWNYTIGLVGKPSAGKSTFYNAVTRALLDARGHRHLAEVAPHPFTTIEPNIGPGWYASFHDEILDSNIIDIDPLHGWCELQSNLYYNDNNSSNDNDNTNININTNANEISKPINRRLLPVIIKDVAGLVPGAYKGRGKGNRFLADLCDADVLIHVIDSSGKSDKDGNIILTADNESNSLKECSNPSEDAEWIRFEIHHWIYNNVKSKWSSIFRKGTKGGVSRLYALFSGYQGPQWNIELALRRTQLNIDNIKLWTAFDLHRLIAYYITIRFPICLALNKIDLISVSNSNSNNSDNNSNNLNEIENIRQIKNIISKYQLEALQRGEIAVPVSARAEYWKQYQLVSSLSLLTTSSSSTTSTTTPTISTTTPTTNTKIFEKDKYDDIILDKCMKLYGTTGVLEVISEAIKLKPPILVYPVNDLDQELPLGWTANMTNEILSKNPQQILPKLRDCIQMKQGSTVEDLYHALKHGTLNHAILQGEFVRAEGKPIRKPSLLNIKTISNNELRKHQLKRETILDEFNSIVRVQTNKKSVWQHTSHSQQPNI